MVGKPEAFRKSGRQSRCERRRELIIWTGPSTARPYRRQESLCAAKKMATSNTVRQGLPIISYDRDWQAWKALSIPGVGR